MNKTSQGPKTAIVNTKDWNIVECMSAARYIEYSAEDFIDIDVFSDPFVSLKKNDVSYMCRQISRCPVVKCNLKKAIIEHRATIMNNIRERKMEEARELIDKLEERFNHIEKTTEVGG